MYPEQPQGGTPGYDPNQPPAWTVPPAPATPFGAPPANVPPASVPPAATQPGYPPASPAPGTSWSYPQQAYPQPASAPPGYPTGSPQPASAPPGYPTGYSPPAPRRPGTRAFVTLIVVSAVLAVGLIATVAIGLSQMNKLKGDRAAVTAQRDAQKQKAEAAAKQLQQEFADADLSGKLAKVKQLDQAADTAFHQFESGDIRFGVLTAAMAACDDAVAEYDQAAAKFPDSMLIPRSLPEKIDLSNTETDCGRAFTQNI